MVEDIDNLPVLKKEEMDVLLQPDVKLQQSAKKSLTVRELLNSDAIGMWKDRTDITDSSTYARQLRERAERRYIDYLGWRH